MQKLLKYQVNLTYLKNVRILLDDASRIILKIGMMFFKHWKALLLNKRKEKIRIKN